MPTYIPREQYMDSPSRPQSAVAAGGLGDNASLEQILQSQEGRFKKYTMPTIEEQLDSLDSTEMVDNAIETNQTAFDGVEAQGQRIASRRGLTMTPSQLRAFQGKLNIGKAEASINNIQGARVQQEERNQGVAADLANRAQGLSSVGVTGLSQANSRDAGRKNANDANSANYRSGLISTAGSLAAAAILL